MNLAATKDSTNLAFDRETFPKSKWHNQRNPKELKEEIIEFEKKNPHTMDHINVIQAQTTPDTKTGAKSVIKSLLTFGKKGGLKG